MKSGFVAVVGRPNAGKSSLLNRLVGQQLAAVSDRPQTTWHQIRGVLSVPEHGQIVFIDTPGVHQAMSAMNRAMLAGALEATLDADAVLIVVDAGQIKQGDSELVQWLADHPHCLVALNKVDLLTPEAYRQAEATVRGWGVETVLPVSATVGAGLAELTAALFAVLPEGPAYYPTDELSDRPMRFLATELIRQAVFEQLQQELPYATFAEIEDWDEGRHPLYIAATLYVERESQKQILIGSGGRQVRAIGTRARELLQTLTGRRVYLDLWVKVLPKWTKKEHHLRRAGLLIEDKRLKRVARLMDAVRGDAGGDSVGRDRQEPPS